MKVQNRFLGTPFPDSRHKCISLSIRTISKDLEGVSSFEFHRNCDAPGLGGADLFVGPHVG